MKPIIYSLLVTFLLYSCSSFWPKKEQTVENQQTDSIALVKMQERERAIADSMVLAERQDQANTAYGQIQFGMDRNAVTKIMNQDLKQGKYKKLGSYTYSFSPVFNDTGNLYLLQLQSEPESSLQLETSIKEKVNNLKEIISVKYGDPLHVYKYPDDFDFVEQKVQWVYTWEFESKIIKLGVATESNISKFKALCHIYDNPKRTKYLNRDKEAHQAKITEAAEGF